MRIILAAVALFSLAACVDSGGPPASDERLKEVAYRAPDRPEITVFTMINNTNGGGAHTALLVSGSQRVIFDPAGSFRHPMVPESRDVLFGVSPAAEQGYKSSHARSSHHVVSQTFVVTPEQAEIALQLVQAYGNVPSAFCTQATSRVLRQVPGFEGIEPVYLPVRLMEQLEQKPGVMTDRLFENDAGDVVDGAAGLRL